MNPKEEKRDPGSRRSLPPQPAIPSHLGRLAVRTSAVSVTAALIVVATLSPGAAQAPPPSPVSAHASQAGGDVVRPGAVVQDARDVLSPRGSIRFASVLSLTGSGPFLYAVLDGAYALHGPPDTSLIGPIVGVTGPLYAVGDVLVESRAESLRILRRRADAGLEEVSVARLDSISCGSPLSPYVLGSHEQVVIVLWRGTDCPYTGIETTISGVDLREPTQPEVITAARRRPISGQERSRWAGAVVGDDLAALASVASGLGGTSPRSSVRLYDVGTMPPHELGWWTGEDIFTVTHLMIAEGHLYIGGVPGSGNIRHYVVDISDPATPAEVARYAELPLFSAARGGYGYGASGDVVHMVGLADATRPRVVDRATVRGYPTRLWLEDQRLHILSQSDGLAWYQSVAIGRGHFGVSTEPIRFPRPTGAVGQPDVSGSTIVYPAGDDGVHVFQGRDPQYIATIPEPADAVGLLEDSTLVTGRGTTLSTLDVSNPYEARVLKRVNVGSVVRDIEIDRGFVIALGATSLLVMDATDLTGDVGRMALESPRALALDFPTAYVLAEAGTAEVKVIDIAVPGMPRVAAAVGVRTDATSLAADRGYLYVTGGGRSTGGTIQILDASQPTRPRWVDHSLSLVTRADRPVASHGYLMVAEYSSLAPLLSQAVVVIDMERDEPAVVQKVPYPGALVSDGSTLLKEVSYLKLSEVFDFRPRPAARLHLDAACGTTSNRTPAITGLAEPENITVTVRAGTDVLDTAMSSSGVFTLTPTLDVGVSNLRLAGESSRGLGQGVALVLTVLDRASVDAWSTVARWAGGASRPRDLQGCVTLAEPWHWVLPAGESVAFEAEAVPNARLRITVDDQGVVLSEVQSGHYRGSLTLARSLPPGTRVSLEVDDGSFVGVFRGAALTRRIYVPAAHSGIAR